MTVMVVIVMKMKMKMEGDDDELAAGRPGQGLAKGKLYVARQQGQCDTSATRQRGSEEARQRGSAATGKHGNETARQRGYNKRGRSGRPQTDPERSRAHDRHA